MRTSDEKFTPCVVCGREVCVLDKRQCYASSSIVLCHECAEAYGGVFDPHSGDWKVAPQERLVVYQAPENA